MNEQQVWIVVVEHKYGTDAWACMSEEIAWSTLDQWAFDWWGEEFPDDPYPPLDCIRDEYFERMSGREGFVLTGPSKIESQMWEPKRKESK